MVAAIKVLRYTNGMILEAFQLMNLLNLDAFGTGAWPPACMLSQDDYQNVLKKLATSFANCFSLKPPDMSNQAPQIVQK